MPVTSMSVTIVALRHGFGSLHSVAVEQRAMALADSITMAMWVSTVGFVLMVVLLVVLAVVHARLSSGQWRDPPGVSGSGGASRSGGGPLIRPRIRHSPPPRWSSRSPRVPLPCS